MFENLGFESLLVLWIVCTVLNGLYILQRDRTSGLTVVYLVRLWMFYWVGGALHYWAMQIGMDGYLIRGTQMTEIGLGKSLIALSAFSLANVATVYHQSQEERGSVIEVSRGDDKEQIYKLIFVGVLSFAVLTVAAGLPTITSFLDAGRELISVGLCALAWLYLKKENTTGVLICAAISIAAPLLTAGLFGFMGVGAAVSITVIIFVLVNVRKRVAALTIGVCMLYLSLSLFVSYAGKRQSIRSSVWGDNDAGQGLVKTSRLVTEGGAFNPYDVQHLQFIDWRLNQSYLVGEAVSHTSRTNEYAQGETITTAVSALIPRVIWPDKPIKLGGTEMASEYTGLRFAASGVSIGIGKVFEFYINYGDAGIVVGYLLFGIVVGYLDVRSANALQRRRWLGFAQWFLPGLMFLKVMGPLHELSVRLVAAFVLAYVLKHVLGDRLARRKCKLS